jgi:hypothetical protein
MTIVLTLNEESVMSNAALSIGYGDVPGFPADSVVDHVLVTASATDPANTPAAQSVAPTTVSVTFANLNADTYTFTAQAFPATGSGFGTPVSVTLTITVPATISLSLPAGVKAAQT